MRTMPPLPLPGGCQCGRIRYRVTAMPMTLYACHCTDCQRQSGSAFGMSMLMEAAHLEVEGAPASFTRTASSGNEMRCHYCPDCGTRIWHERIGADRLVLKPGTLDDAGWLHPVGHIWTDSRQPWVVLPEGAPTWPGQPDMARLQSAWQDHLNSTTT